MSGLVKICIFGPESTGKSTLAARLAAHFETRFVPEYAKELIASQNGAVTPEDIPRIARGQMEREDRLAAESGRLLICDTDLITTLIWSEWLFGSCPDWIREEAGKRAYDLYLLTDIDVPWVDDVHRFLPEDRANFLARCEEELVKRGIPYRKLSGSWEARFGAACEAIDKLIKS